MDIRNLWTPARRFTAAAAIVMAGIAAPPASASTQQPSRLSDEQVERLLERIEKAADKYRESIDDALDKSKANDTKLEDDVNRYVREFEDATDRLEKRFDDEKASPEDVQDVLTRAARLDAMMGRHEFTDRSQSDWRLLRNDLTELSRAYGVVWEWRAAVRP